MEQPTQAIVLHATKYGETSVILHAYTQQEGLRSYVVKGVRLAKRKKTFSMGMFQPLTQLELVATTPKRAALSVLKSAKIINPYTTISTQITKSSIFLPFHNLILMCKTDSFANTQTAKNVLMEAK